jgi:hypothetical protein
MTALEKMRKNGISIDEKTIYDIAERYNLKELSVFGSSVLSLNFLELTC